MIMVIFFLMLFFLVILGELNFGMDYFEGDIKLI